MDGRGIKFDDKAEPIQWRRRRPQRRKALLEQVLPRWATRCGAECVKNWNDSVGKVVNLTAKAN